MAGRGHQGLVDAAGVRTGAHVLGHPLPAVHLGRPGRRCGATAPSAAMRCRVARRHLDQVRCHLQARDAGGRRVPRRSSGSGRPRRRRTARAAPTGTTSATSSATSTVATPRARGVAVGRSRGRAMAPGPTSLAGRGDGGRAPVCRLRDRRAPCRTYRPVPTTRGPPWPSNRPSSSSSPTASGAASSARSSAASRPRASSCGHGAAHDRARDRRGALRRAHRQAVLRRARRLHHLRTAGRLAVAASPRSRACASSPARPTRWRQRPARSGATSPR